MCKHLDYKQIRLVALENKHSKQAEDIYFTLQTHMELSVLLKDTSDMGDGLEVWTGIRSFGISV